MDYAEPVTVVNRVRTADGRPIPYSAYVGGDVIVIQDQVTLPPGLASIAVHGSMYALDPTRDGDTKKYRLGVAEWGLPVDLLLESAVQEDIERREQEKLHEYDKTRGTHKFVGRRVAQPIRRHDPVQMGTVGPRSDGVAAAGFGDAVTK